MLPDKALALQGHSGEKGTALLGHFGPVGTPWPAWLAPSACAAHLDVILHLLVPLLGRGELGVREGFPEALLREERLQLQEGRHLAVLRDELPVVCEEVH